MSETLRTAFKAIKTTAEYTYYPALNQIGAAFNYIDKETNKIIEKAENPKATDFEKTVGIVVATGKGIIPSPEKRAEFIEFAKGKYEEYSDDFNAVFGCNNQEESHISGGNAAEAPEL